MLNKDFVSGKDLYKINKISTVISNSIHTELNKELLEKILIYIPINLQCYIKACNTVQEFTNHVYNGYTITDDDDSYIIKRQNTTIINGNITVGYRQKDNVCQETIINQPTDLPLVALVNHDLKGFDKVQQTPVCCKQYQLLICKECDNSNENS